MATETTNNTPGSAGQNGGLGWVVVDKLCVGGLGPCVDDANGNQVACIGPYVEYGASKARLFAAAPQMIEALKVVQTGLEERAEMYGMESDALRLVRAAIAAATGEGK